VRERKKQKLAFKVQQLGCTRECESVWELLDMWSGMRSRGKPSFFFSEPIGFCMERKT